MKEDIVELLAGYDLSKLTIGVLGGHSALDVCHGVKKYGFKTLAVCQKGREKTYSTYFKTDGEKGCVDEVILVDKFADVVNPEVQKQLQDKNTIFVHNRYFWVYCDFDKVENNFKVPIYGTRGLVKLEERDQPNNQYILLEKAGIRIPKIIRRGGENLNDEDLRARLDDHFRESTNPLLVKANEAQREYERAFFTITSTEDYFDKCNFLLERGIIDRRVESSVIEEFVIGSQVNFNYFYSPLTKQLELLGTDFRRQTSLDGFLRLDAETQLELSKSGYRPSLVENGHIACTVKESLLEKAFEAGERFLEVVRRETDSEMIGPFALQGAFVTGMGKEEFVVFDVSMRIPGSPGTRFTPWSAYLYGDPVSYGERIGMELKKAIASNELVKLLT